MLPSTNTTIMMFFVCVGRNIYYSVCVCVVCSAPFAHPFRGVASTVRAHTHSRRYVHICTQFIYINDVFMAPHAARTSRYGTGHRVNELSLCVLAVCGTPSLGRACSRVSSPKASAHCASVRSSMHSRIMFFNGRVFYGFCVAVSSALHTQTHKFADDVTQQRRRRRRRQQQTDARAHARTCCVFRGMCVMLWYGGTHICRQHHHRMCAMPLVHMHIRSQQHTGEIPNTRVEAVYVCRSNINAFLCVRRLCAYAERLGASRRGCLACLNSDSTADTVCKRARARLVFELCVCYAVCVCVSVAVWIICL